MPRLGQYLALIFGIAISLHGWAGDVANPEDLRLLAVNGYEGKWTADLAYRGVIFSIAPGDETIEGWKAESVAQNYVVIRSGDGQDGSSPKRRTLTFNGQTILDPIPSLIESSSTTGNSTAVAAVATPVDQVVPSKSITSVNVSAVESKAVPVPEFKPGAATSITWQATVGSPMKQVLKAWARAAQWELAWDDGIPNYQFPNQKEFFGSLVDAISGLVECLPDSHKVQITMYEGDKVIHVHTR